jgi:hypothetical protein
MTRVLGELLGASQPDFSNLIQRLERAAGRPSADIRVTHDVAQKVRDASVSLHLDANASTNQELYAALQNRLHIDEQKILQGLSVHNSQDIELLLWSVQRFVQKQVQGHAVLAVKQVAFKRILKSQQPKKAMRALGYRSLDSMLKHESAASLVAAVSLTESASWLKKLHKQYQALGINDFELRDITVFQPRTARWKKLGQTLSHQRKHNVLAFGEAGTVAILPMQQYIQGLAVVDLVIALQKCNDIYAISTYLKLQQMTPQFGEEVTRVASARNIGELWLGDQDVSWQTLHNYLARQADVRYFDPYIDARDLFVIPVEKTLEALHPAMSFWADLSHGLRYDGSGLLSCNVLDVAISYCNKLQYTQASVSHAQQKLWHEVTSRYLSPASVERQLLPVLQPIPQEIELPDLPDFR